MLKHQAAITSVLVAVLFLPPQGGAEQEQLSGALHQVNRALGVVEEIQKAVEQESPESIALILSSTESPHLMPRELDTRLGDLRKEVSLLQMELDALDSRRLVPPGTAPRSTGSSPPRGARERTVLPPGFVRPTYGMDEATRRALTGTDGKSDETPRTTGYSRPVPDPAPTSHPGASAPTPHLKESPEYDGYSADPLSQARACYRAGKYQRGLDLLAVREDTESLYWRARCLERLGQIDEAIDLLDRVIEAEGESFEGRRAKNDAEFFRWKKAFLEDQPTGMRAGRSEG